jgi:LmbE family N-acetylglucosaminyl deacetylase
MMIEPADYFQGTIVIVVPHMDDEVLACGGTLARLPDKARIHLIYATDGRGSPAPVLPWFDPVSADLNQIRRQEALAAMSYLGVPPANVHFLDLPDGQLMRHRSTLHRHLLELVVALQPAYILIPFRYDRHPDHLALNHVVTSAYRQGTVRATLLEYFVYYRWRLLPGGDVRHYIDPCYLWEVDIAEVSAHKRVALDCFKSQTTCFFTWQKRPNLTSNLLDEVSQAPELFLLYQETKPGPAIFTGSILRIRLAHRLEPFLKKKKDQVVALWRRGFA